MEIIKINSYLKNKYFYIFFFVFFILLSIHNHFFNQKTFYIHAKAELNKQYGKELDYVVNLNNYCEVLRQIKKVNNIKFNITFCQIDNKRLYLRYKLFTRKNIQITDFDNQFNKIFLNKLKDKLLNDIFLTNKLYIEKIMILKKEYIINEKSDFELNYVDKNLINQIDKNTYKLLVKEYFAKQQNNLNILINLNLKKRDAIQLIMKNKIDENINLLKTTDYEKKSSYNSFLLKLIIRNTLLSLVLSFMLLSFGNVILNFKN